MSIKHRNKILQKNENSQIDQTDVLNIFMEQNKTLMEQNKMLMEQLKKHSIPPPPPPPKPTIIEYLTEKCENAKNQFDYYRELLKIPLAEEKYPLDFLLETSHINVVHDFFVKRMEITNSFELPFHTHKNKTYVKINGIWAEAVEEHSIVNAYIEPLCMLVNDLHTKYCDDGRNNMGDKKEAICQLLLTYGCMRVKDKLTIFKKMSKHPKVSIDIV
jgi:hypothetical protein